METFGELLSQYIERAGISDSELARSIGVRRQTLFRWKDGQIRRPRYRDDVLRCANRLRLTPDERDKLLTAAGFPPETPPAPAPDAPPAPVPDDAPSDAPSSEEAEETDKGTRIRPSRKAWILGFAGGLAIIIGAVLATAMLSNSNDGNQTAIVAPTPAPTPAPTTAPTPLPTASPATTPPTASPTPAPEEGPDEDVVVIARFVNYIGGNTGFNVAGRIRSAIEEELEGGFLPSVRIETLDEDIRDEAEAQEVAARTNASIVIWGEYDSGRAQARFTVPAPADSMQDSQVELPIVNPSDLTATINTELPHHVRLLALLIFAHLYKSGEDAEQAREALTEALSPLPKESDTLATIYFRLGYLNQVHEPPDPSGALHYYTLALSQGSPSPSSYFNRALVYSALDDLDEAISDYSESLFLDPRDPAVLHSRGVAYLNRKKPGDAVRAVDDLSKAIAIDRSLLDSYYARGLAYYEMGERFYEDALADILHVYELRPDDPESSRAVCWLMTAAQQAESAIPYCDDAVRKGAEGSRFSRGAAYLHLTGADAMSKAVTDFNAAIRADPTDVKAYMNRGRAYFKLGASHYDQAIDDFRRILTIDADHTGALNNLCWHLSLTNRPAEGLPYCDRAIAIDPNYGLAFDSRGLAYALQGEYEKAALDFTKFLEWAGAQPGRVYEEYRPTRERWLSILNAGENPFDEDELLTLLNE